MSKSTEENITVRKYPFKHMKLKDHTVLDSIEGRHKCYICTRSRKFFCYSCYVPVGNMDEIIPKVQIPVNIDIIKHKAEIDGKSTAIHAAILAGHNVRIHNYPDIPDYRLEEKVVLIFPSVDSLTVPQLFNRNVHLKSENNYGLPKGHNLGTMIKKRVEEVIEGELILTKTYTYENLPVKRAVFIDSTWNQSRGIYKDPRVHELPSVILQNRCSQFWRHQRGSPRWYLATIEAIHQFLLEVHVNAWGLNKNYRGLENLEIAQGFFNIARLEEHHVNCIDSDAPYNGHYDNLLFFFAHMYDLIHSCYDHNKLKSYRRPF